MATYVDRAESYRREGTEGVPCNELVNYALTGQAHPGGKAVFASEYASYGTAVNIPSAGDLAVGKTAPQRYHVGMFLDEKTFIHGGTGENNVVKVVRKKDTAELLNYLRTYVYKPEYGGMQIRRPPSDSASEVPKLQNARAELQRSVKGMGGMLQKAYDRINYLEQTIAKEPEVLTMERDISSFRQEQVRLTEIRDKAEAKLNIEQSKIDGDPRVIRALMDLRDSAISGLGQLNVQAVKGNINLVESMLPGVKQAISSARSEVAELRKDIGPLTAFITKVESQIAMLDNLIRKATPNQHSLGQTN